MSSLLFKLWKRMRLPWYKRKAIDALLNIDGYFILFQTIKSFISDEIIVQLALNMLLVISAEVPDDLCKRLLELDTKVIDFHGIIALTLQHTDQSVCAQGKLLNIHLINKEDGFILSDIHRVKCMLQHNLSLDQAYVMSFPEDKVINGVELLLKCIGKVSRIQTIIPTLDVLLMFSKQGRLFSLTTTQLDNISSFLIKSCRSNVSSNSIKRRVCEILSEIFTHEPSIHCHFSTEVTKLCVDIIGEWQQNELSFITTQQALFTLSRVIESTTLTQQGTIQVTNGNMLKINELPKKDYFVPLHLRQGMLKCV